MSIKFSDQSWSSGKWNPLKANLKKNINSSPFDKEVSFTWAKKIASDNKGKQFFHQTF